MTAASPDKQLPSASARAEAAAWVARLHGPNRTAEVEAGLRRWLADDPEHSAAFELLTDTWDKSARLRRRPMEQVASWERSGFRVSFSRAVLASLAICALAVVATVHYLHNDAVTTGIGELRTLTLADGTRIHLNTDTRVRTQYDKRARKVILDHGEALFEVAKHADWPFIVTAGGEEIKALGTSFVVRRDARDLEITLVEGAVSVTPTHLAAVATGSGSGDAHEPMRLTPGQRVRFASDGVPRVDRPAVERVTAWEHGQVFLDDTPLAEAVAEMNRYSREPIVLDASMPADIRVSGVFEAGDAANFAQALAQAYHLSASKPRNGAIVLSRRAQQ